jgi:putative ABC transport system permease protein
MLRHYLKTAWMNLVRNKAHTAINLTGLAVGLTCGLLILLWVQNELAMDVPPVNRERVYAVYDREFFEHVPSGSYNTSGPLAWEVKKQLPEVEMAASMEEENADHTFQVPGKLLKLSGAHASAEIFGILGYPLVTGTVQMALRDPVSIAISEKMAGELFGGADNAMGKTVRYEDKKDLKVTAVFRDLGEHYSRKFDYLINWDTYLVEHPGVGSWQNTGPMTLLLLRADANPAAVERKLMHFMGKFITEDDRYRVESLLQRYDEVYLHSVFVNGVPVGGRIAYVHLFSIVAAFILLMACVNFMNLTTARSVRRAREIGVRKVMGAARMVLVRQFMGESLLLTVLAVAVSLVLMGMVLPLFNYVTQKKLVLPFGEVGFWLRVVLLTIVTGFVAGSYPALYLSGFRPVVVLKGRLALGAGAVWFRKGLVVFQFVLSAVLIVATIIVSRQVNYIQRMDLGYDRENLVYIPIEGEMAKQYRLFKEQALKLPGVAAVSHISVAPTAIDNTTTSIEWDGKRPDQQASFAVAAVGYDFVPTMKLRLSAGRDFSRNFPRDAYGFIVNEAAAAEFGYANPVGRSITMWGGKGLIIGLVKDFHFASVHDPMMPLIVYFERNDMNGGQLLVRIKPGQTKVALAGLEGIWRGLNPAFPFSYAFSDERYRQLYRSEEVVGRLADIFAVLAIFISCLGLLGLAMFTAEQRVKEIGIRKVLGAGVGALFGLLSAEFFGLVGIALLIAAPLSWYGMREWLGGYAYHTNMPWWVFVAAAGLVFVIALVTVSFQAVRAALVNPIRSLRSE